MARQGVRLTAQQEHFARLVVEEGHSFVGAYRIAYPPRNGTRSPAAERVAARRVAHHALVEQRIEQLREELLASDPIELRRKASGALARILSGQLDPKYRVAAMTTLRYLDGQERASARNDREALRTIKAQMAALDAMESRATNRSRSTAAGPQAEERPPANIDRIIDEIGALMAEQRPRRDIEPIPAQQSSPEDPQPAAEEAIQLQATPVVDQPMVSQVSEFRLARKPGTFGIPVWSRQPDSQ